MSNRRTNQKMIVNQHLYRNNVINTLPNQDINNNNFITFGEMGVERTFKSPKKYLLKNINSGENKDNNNSINKNVYIYNQNINVGDSKNFIRQKMPQIRQYQINNIQNYCEQNPFPQNPNRNMNNINKINNINTINNINLINNINTINNINNKNTINNIKKINIQNNNNNNIGINKNNTKANFYQKISPKNINNIPINNQINNPINSPINNLNENHRNSIIKNKRNRNFQQNNDYSVQNLNVPKNLIRNFGNIIDIVPEKPKKEEKKKELALTGLKNLGNTSYLNSVLQLFCSIKYLKNFFCNLKHPKQFEKQETTLSFVIHRLFMHIYSNHIKREIYQPECILKVLKHYNKYYDLLNNINGEKNPNELIVFLLDKLHDELNSKKYNNNNNKENNNYYSKYDKNNVISNGFNYFKENNDSIFSDYFTWFSLKTNECINCGTKFYSFNNFFTFDLNISGKALELKNLSNPKNLKIIDCIEYYYLGKTIRNFCDNCKNYFPIRTINQIFSTPNIFIFLLDQNEIENINFILEKEINLQKFFGNGRQRQIPTKYALSGIVFFDKNKKKYNSLCISCIDNNWYLYDDEQVSLYNNFDSFINEVNFGKNKIYMPNILLYINIDIDKK